MRVAIFNGFPFHHETFGVFLHYTKNKSYEVTLFTNQEYSYNWFNVYKRLFGECFTLKKHTEFTEDEFNSHDFIIVTTDDDFSFNDTFMLLPNASNKVLTYDHDYRNRRPSIRYHVGTRPYTTRNRHLPYIYAAYPCITIEDKITTLVNEPYINITLVGGYIEDIVEKINFLKLSNDIRNIKFHFVDRYPRIEYINLINSTGLDVAFYYGIDTDTMFELLKKTHYLVFVGKKHIFDSSSGSVGLSFCTGCTMLMSKEYNTDYQFKNAIFFEDSPTLQRIPNLNKIYDEQQDVIENNIKILDSFIEKTGYYST